MSEPESEAGVGQPGPGDEATVDFAKPTPGQISTAVGRAVVVLAVGVLCAVTGWPTSALPRLVAWLLLVVGISATMLEVTVRSGYTDQPHLAARPARELWSGWLLDNEENKEVDQLELVRHLYYDGKGSRAREVRFALLMAFASAIAAAGVIADSTAVVIGAMLIAPLITPMMGMALGLTMGWQTKLIKASKMVLLGIVIAVFIGWAMPSLVLSAVDVTSNSQIVSRSSPTLIDLVIAIAAGAAGSYALARPDVSSSLPGVAIAIALVPPLGVLGILLQAQEWRLATGAGLLFATNLVAILLAGGLVFVITGLAPLRRLNDSQHRIKVLLGALGFTSILVVGALAANGASITADAINTEEARTATLDWLDGSDFALVSIELRDQAVSVVLAGAGEPPSANDLATRLSEAIGQPVDLRLQWIQRNQILVPGG